MIQIVCCSCMQRKLRSDKVAFYTDADKKLYDNIDKIFVALCPIDTLTLMWELAPTLQTLLAIVKSLPGKMSQFQSTLL